MPAFYACCQMRTADAFPARRVLPLRIETVCRVRSLATIQSR